MAVVYFTSNAATGAGSLSEAIQNAQPGDVVRPDETVFERGSTIEIVLASPLRFTKDLTLDASPFRVRLDGGEVRQCVAIAVKADANAVVEFTAFDFVRGKHGETGGGIFAGGSLILNRCGIYGCSGAYGGGVYCRYSLTLNDCVVTGCNATATGGGIYSNGDATLNGVTVVGNVAPTGADVRFGNGVANASNSVIGDVYTSKSASANYVGSVVDVASSAVGFVESPPDDLTVETWDANAWQNWDLRLLDDASGAPSPYRDSGDVGAMSQYDLQGNFRGRESNGATTCSPGAYETIQADLFWIGRDASGAEVETPSFLTSDGWATSRFATVSGDAAPQPGQTLFIDGAVTFGDVPSTSSNSTLNLVVGGGANVSTSSTSAVYWGTLTVGASSVCGVSSIPTKVCRVGAWARLTKRLLASFECKFDANACVEYGYFYIAKISPIPVYGQLVVAPSAALSVRLDGVYVCDFFKTTDEGTSPTRTIKIGDRATIRAKSATFGASATAPFETLFDKRVTIALQGNASASVGAAAPESWADAFEVDLSETTSATLTLNGQTIYGDAPTAEITLTGSAKVDARGLDVASLTLNADATLTAENATVNAETLNLAAGSTLTVDGGSVDAESLTSTADSALTIVGATVNVATLTVADGANVAFSGTDAVLAATASATVGAATFSGTGYFATPTGTDVTAATFETSVRACDYGASLTSFLAATGVTGVALAWTVENAEAFVLLERQSANGWAVVEARAVDGFARVDGLEPGTTLFRAFDGAQFLTAQTLVQASHVRLDYNDSSVVALAPVYEVVLEIVLMSDYRNRGESPLLLARVADSATGDFIPKDAVASIVYSARRVETLYGSKRCVDVEGHVDREIPLDAYLAIPIADDPRWSASYPNDERGYNFRFEPDSTKFPVLPEPGDYEIVVEIRFRQGNPAPLVFRTRVV